MDEITPERWLPVIGYEGIYEVSDLGRVRSLDRYVSARGCRPYLQRGRLLKPAAARNGYGHRHVELCRDGRSKTRHVHQLVMEAFAGPCPGGLEIRHLDGDAANNRLSNLVYGTSSENGYDITRHGRNNHANKTHCDNGHEFTLENTRIIYRPDGRFKQRECVICRRKVAREWARNKRVRDREAA